MNLNAWLAQKRRGILESLTAGQPPAEGEFSEEVLVEGRVKGAPQMGAVRLEPRRVMLEFIYSDPASSATILTVTLEPPERVVFLPVPDWVVESIWQGEVTGSAHFESDAMRLVQAFEQELREEANARWFEPQPPKRRE